MRGCCQLLFLILYDLYFLNDIRFNGKRGVRLGSKFCLFCLVVTSMNLVLSGCRALSRTSTYTLCSST